jgi:hypothetical protein
MTLFGGFRPRPRATGDGRRQLSSLLQSFSETHGAAFGGNGAETRRKTAVEILDEALGISMSTSAALPSGGAPLLLPCSSTGPDCSNASSEGGSALSPQ